MTRACAAIGGAAVARRQNLRGDAVTVEFDGAPATPTMALSADGPG